MISIDEEALICDFAETYHVFNYRELPVCFAGTLAAGLRDNSRIKMKIAGMPTPLDTLLAASMVDYMAAMLWVRTGGKGKHPESVLQKLYKPDHDDDITTGFNTPEEFMHAWNARSDIGENDG